MKYLVRLAAGLIGLAGLILLSGYLLPARHEAAAVVSVQATPEAIWAVLTSVENYPRWRSDIAITEVIRSKPVQQWRQSDARGREAMHCEGAGRPVEKWVDSLIGDGRLGGKRIWLLVPEPTGGTRIALTEIADIRDPLARFQARFVNGYAKDLRQVLQDLRKRLGE
ncbi:MAG: Polyketide cyclase/dehydrase [Fibrobacteres bacterium]|nr:Polyketide cyclase/dehydrase [Fibrobacterota bacterium]